MIVYLACSGMMFESYPILKELIIEKGLKFHELRSYWEIKDFTGHTLPVYGGEFFLDSGAFSAWSQGAEVRIDEYAEYLRKYGSQMAVYANLDSIPKDRSPEAVQTAAEETLANQTYLEEQGVTPIPVFHKGEPYSYLQDYLEKYEYLCLGGLVSDAKSGENSKFFDIVWDKYLTDGAGRPTHKVHAFGMTSIKHMLPYPWYSVDSSTWLIHSKIGSIMFPKQTADGANYNKKGYLIAVSDRSTARSEIGSHYDNAPKEMKEHVLKYLTDLNIKMEDVASLPYWRMAANMEYWISVQNQAAFSDTFRQRQMGLL